MAKTPPIPPDQRNFRGPRPDPSLREDDSHSHPADKGGRTRDRGRSAVSSQSAGSTHWKSQER
jgi:hypothetical protein